MSKVGEVQGYLYTKVILYFVCIKLSNEENIYYLNWENSALNTAIKITIINEHDLTILSRSTVSIYAYNNKLAVT